MEISLVSSDGVAQDSILSIRAGATKRQAPVNSGKAFRFPKLAMEDNPLRVALLQQVGSAFLVLKPSDGQYRVFFDSGASCEVAVQQVAGGAEGFAGEGPAASSEKKESAAQAAEAKDYLERHKVLQFVQAVLQALIKERPEDPYSYMARHFTSGYTQTPPPSREQAQKSEPAPQQGQAFQPRRPAEAPPQPRTAPQAPTKAAAAPREAAGKAPDPEALKKSLQSSLVKACKDGSLSKSLEGLVRQQPKAEARQQPKAEAPDSSQEALRKNLQSTLLQACESGALSASLAKLPRNKAAGQQASARGGGGGRPAEAVAAAAAGEPEEIRLKARDMLVQATKDGSLDSAIGTVLKEVNEESRIGQGKQDEEVEVERIREKMQGMLVSASQDGSLVEAVKAEAHAERVEQSRMLLQGTLLQAIQEGTLESALGQAKAGQN